MSDKLSEAIAAVQRAFNREGGPDCVPLLDALDYLKALQKQQNREKEEAPSRGPCSSHGD